MLFDDDPMCLNLYRILEDRVTSELENVTVVWKKTQPFFVFSERVRCRIHMSQLQ